jgi:site-specific DNA recombinase
MSETNVAAAPTRAAGYVRVSQERNVRDCYGLESQEADVHRLVKYRRLVLVDIYREEGASGYSPAASLRSAGRLTKHRMRPELERFLADAKAGKWDVAVFPSIDRAGRSVRDVIEIDAMLRKAGVDVVFVRENLDTSTPIGEFFRNIMASMAQLEGQIIAERLSKGRRCKAAKGGYIGGWLPYGYRHENGGVAVVPRQADAVRRIFESRATGMPYEKIAWRLSMDKVPTQRGGTWQVSTLRRIVSNRFYTGRREIDGETVTGKHEPIISCELFGRATAGRSRTIRARHRR